MKINIAEIIESGQASLGIELGSTRIKAVLIAPDTSVLASGDYTCNLYTSTITRDAH